MFVRQGVTKKNNFGGGFIKTKRTLIILAILGVLLGVAMQLSGELQGQWSWNFVTLMASDIGCWAVIAILIASNSKSFLQSGCNCLIFNVGMVAGYYAMAPYSATYSSNYIWLVMALLMFPIGMYTYWCKNKLTVLFSIIIFLVMSIGLKINNFVQQMQINQIPVHSKNGDVNNVNVKITKNDFVRLPILIQLIYHFWQIN